MKRSKYPVSSDNHRVDVVSAEIHLLQVWGSFRDPGIAKGFPEPVCGAFVTLLCILFISGLYKLLSD